MKNNKKLIMGVIAFLAIGFAAVSTTLYLTGTLNIGANLDDYDVYFSNAKVNGVEDKSVITDDTHITFEASLKDIGEEYELEYFITNGSRNYDSSVSMNCTSTENEYLSIINTWVNPTTIEATNTLSGVLTATMTKGYVEEEETEIEVTCNITANAVERDSLGEGTSANKVKRIPVTSTNTNGDNLNATSYEITGTEKDELLDKLVETNMIDSADDVNLLIEVKADAFEDMATTTFDVSSIADDGDTVVILHFDEDKQEWEFIAEETVTNGTVTGDFSSYSPVAFVVKKSDGSYETVVPVDNKYVVVSDNDSNGVVSLGDEIAVGEEHFYVISNDGTTINALAKYNLNAGNMCTSFSSSSCTPIENPTYKQDEAMTGVIEVDGTWKYGNGSLVFSDNNGWPYSNNDTIDIQAYDGPVKTAINAYKAILPEGIEVRLITKAEIEALVNDGATLSFGSIKDKADAKGVSWLYSTSYWSGSANADYANFVWFVSSFGNFSYSSFDSGINLGVRPVISLES